MTNEEMMEKWRQTISHIDAACKFVADLVSHSDKYENHGNSCLLLLSGVMIIAWSDLASLEEENAKKRSKKGTKK